MEANSPNEMAVVVFHLSLCCQTNDIPLSFLIKKQVIFSLFKWFTVIKQDNPDGLILIDSAEGAKNRKNNALYKKMNTIPCCNTVFPPPGVCTRVLLISWSQRRNKPVGACECTNRSNRRVCENGRVCARVCVRACVCVCVCVCVSFLLHRN